MALAVDHSEKVDGCALGRRHGGPPSKLVAMDLKRTSRADTNVNMRVRRGCRVYMRTASVRDDGKDAASELRNSAHLPSPRELTDLLLSAEGATNSYLLRKEMGV